MGELSSYSLSDFILFSDNAYYRLFELYNQAIWPLHLVAIAFALVIVFFLWKKPAWAGRVIAVLLTLSWVWVAWAFLYERFYQIHIVANWYAFAFILQAGLITWYGVIKNQFSLLVQSKPRANLGLVLLFISLIIYPFIALVAGRNWLQFEMFMLAPDPTVLATLAILVLCKVSSVLYVVPVIWLLISSVTLIVM